MNLTPREKDKLLVSVAAMVADGARVAHAQLSRGGGADTDYVLEGARDGKMSPN